MPARCRWRKTIKTANLCQLFHTDLHIWLASKLKTCYFNITLNSPWKPSLIPKHVLFHFTVKMVWNTHIQVHPLISHCRKWFTWTSSLMSSTWGPLFICHFKAHACRLECLLSKLFAIIAWIVILPCAAPLDLPGEFHSHCESSDSMHSTHMQCKRSDFFIFE